MACTAVYPGTFDPITTGHRNIAIRAAQITEKLYIAVANNLKKGPLFSAEERAELISLDLHHYFQEHPEHQYLAERIEIKFFDTLLVDFVRNLGAKTIVRGLRAASDFEFEFQMASMNARIAPDIETIFLTAGDNHHFVSSSFVKEIASLGGDIHHFTSPEIEKRLKERLQKSA